MTDTAARLAARNLKTIWIHEDGRTREDTPPDADAAAWFQFRIRRVNTDELEREGLLMVYAVHDLHRAASEKLKTAQDDHAAWEKDLPSDERESRKRPYRPPESDDEERFTHALLQSHAQKFAVLARGLVEPRYEDVADALGTLETPLFTAIVNFSGVNLDPKAPSGS